MRMLSNCSEGLSHSFSLPLASIRCSQSPGAASCLPSSPGHAGLQQTAALTRASPVSALRSEQRRKPGALRMQLSACGSMQVLFNAAVTSRVVVFKKPQSFWSQNPFRHKDLGSKGQTCKGP